VDTYGLESLFIEKPTDMAPGVKKTRIGPLVLKAGREYVVTHGKIASDIAEQAFVDILIHWGLDSNTEEQRNDIVEHLAVAALSGTSVAADLESVVIDFEGSKLPLATMATVLKTYTNQPNPIRVFYRSYRKALIPCTAYAILSSPENMHYRDAAMLRYGVSETGVKYAFDMVNDAVPHLGLSGYEINLARAVNVGYLSGHAAELRERGASAAPQDTSSRQAAAGAAVGSGGTMPAAPRNDRIMLAPIR